MPGLGDRKARLHQIARQLEPRPSKLPYYVISPMPWEPEDSRAWWMREADGSLSCLGVNAVRAEMALLKRLELKHAGRQIAQAS